MPDLKMLRSRTRWPWLLLSIAMRAGLGAGGLRLWKSRILARDHALRAQKALDAMGSQYATIALCTEGLKKARRSTDRARYESIRNSSQRTLAKLEDVAASHERLARYYGYEATFKRPEKPDP